MSSAVDLHTRLESFLSKSSPSKTITSSPLERLNSFLVAARPLLQVAQNEEAVEPKQPPPDVGKMGRFFEELKPLLASARKRGDFNNPWIIAGLKRDEVKNTAVLAGLWNPSAGGEMAVQFLNNFLEPLRTKAPDGHELPTLEQLQKHYSIGCEQCPLGDQSDRMDILIEGDEFLLCIEVKIDAILQPNQLQRYDAALQQRARGVSKKHSVVFLTVSKPSIQELATHGTWKDVAAAARKTLSAKRSTWSFNQHLLEFFAQHVVKF
jgi:hypothetical protein